MHEILTCSVLPAPAADWAMYSRAIGVILSTVSNVWWQLSSRQPKKGSKVSKGTKKDNCISQKKKQRKEEERNQFKTHFLDHTQKSKYCRSLFLLALIVKLAELIDSEGTQGSPSREHRPQNLPEQIPAQILCAVFCDKEFRTYVIPIFASWNWFLLH